MNIFTPCAWLSAFKHKHACKHTHTHTHTHTHKHTHTHTHTHAHTYTHTHSLTHSLKHNTCTHTHTHTHTHICSQRHSTVSSVSQWPTSCVPLAPPPPPSPPPSPPPPPPPFHHTPQTSPQKIIDDRGTHLNNLDGGDGATIAFGQRLLLATWASILAETGWFFVSFFSFIKDG